MSRTSTTPRATTPAKTHPCPRCRQPAAWQDNPFRPFCSERCRLIDLGTWADEQYRIPGDPVKTTEDDNDPD